MAAKFQTFRIRILSKVDGLQVELADVGDKKMIIATDISYPIADDVYHQEAYGLAVFAVETEIDEISAVLVHKLKTRRAKLKGEA